MKMKIIEDKEVLHYFLNEKLKNLNINNSKNPSENELENHSF